MKEDNNSEVLQSDVPNMTESLLVCENVILEMIWPVKLAITVRVGACQVVVCCSRVRILMKFEIAKACE